VTNGTDVPEPTLANLNRCTAEVSRLDPHKTGTRDRQKTAPSNTHIAGPRWLIKAVLGPGGDTVVSPDGVVSQVRQVRPRALINGNGGRS
jgi:hypothetical protein